MTNPNLSRLPRGSGALLSVLIISALLLVLATAASLRMALVAASLEGTEDHAGSIAAAWSCADMARMRLDADSNRFSDGPVRIMLSASTSCAILSGSVLGNTASMQAQGHAGGSYANLAVIAARASSTAPFYARTWKEY